MATALDLTQQSFGQWLVLGKGRRTVHGQFWICVCQAGCVPKTQVELHEAALLEDRTRGCGCRKPPGCRRAYRNLIGQQYGDYLVLARAESGPAPRLSWLARCGCGRETVVLGTNLVGGQQSRCRKCRARVASPVRVQRWYKNWFVLARVGVWRGPSGTVQSVFLCRCGGCGHVQHKRSSALLSVQHQQCRQCTYPQMVRLEQQQDRIVTLLHAGYGSKTIARLTGVSRDAVRAFRRRHYPYIALVASLPVDEELIAEVS